MADKIICKSCNDTGAVCLCCGQAIDDCPCLADQEPCACECQEMDYSEDAQRKSGIYMPTRTIPLSDES